jgi:phage baseplate assembly protein W
MPTQVIRVNPLDLQGNIAIGVALPFDQPGVFKSTYSTKDQIKSNLINLLLTNKGERVFNPEFGSDINRTLFEGITEETASSITDLIKLSTKTFMPEIEVINVKVDIESPDQYTLRVTVEYIILISGTSDQVTVEFT